MARQRYGIDEDRIARLQKEGRGQGRGADYHPWLTIQDVPSQGRSHRLKGIKTGRVHHLLSDIEHEPSTCSIGQTQSRTSANSFRWIATSLAVLRMILGLSIPTTLAAAPL